MKNVLSDINAFRFKNVLVTPHYAPNGTGNFPSFIGYISIPFQYGSHFQVGEIRQKNSFTTKYDYVCEQPSILLGALHCSYGHFLIQSLSRLYILKQLPSNYSLIFHSNLNPSAQFYRYQQELFKYYGIINPVFLLNRPTLFKEIIIAPSGSAVNGYFCREQLDALAITDSNPIKGKRIYLSRAHMEHKFYQNEWELHKILARRGWEIVYLESLSITKQFEKLATAQTILAMSGAALHSLLAIRNIKARCIVLPRVHDDTYKQIAQLKCPDYWLLNVNLKLVMDNANFLRKQYVLDLGQIEHLLDKSNDFDNIAAITQYAVRPPKPGFENYESIPHVLCEMKKPSCVADNLFYRIMESNAQGVNIANSFMIILQLVIRRLLQEYMQVQISKFLNSYYPKVAKPFQDYCGSVFNSKMQGGEAARNSLIALVSSIMGQLNSCVIDGQKYRPALIPIKDYQPASLQEIGKWAGTDKASRWHDYLDFYEGFWGRLKDASFNLVEVGVDSGASLKMWENYFLCANIYGIDISNVPQPFSRAVFIRGDATDRDFMENIVRDLNPALFIDDGSNRYSHQIKIFEIVFPILKSGAYYVCEDLEVCFGEYRKKAYNDCQIDSASYFSALSLLALNGCQPDFHPRFEHLTDSQLRISRFIDFMIFRRHCVLIKKK